MHGVQVAAFTFGAKSQVLICHLIMNSSIVDWDILVNGKRMSKSFSSHKAFVRRFETGSESSSKNEYKVVGQRSSISLRYPLYLV